MKKNLTIKCGRETRQGKAGGREKDVDQVITDQRNHQLDKNAGGLLPAQQPDGRSVDGHANHTKGEVSHTVQIKVEVLHDHNAVKILARLNEDEEATSLSKAASDDDLLCRTIAAAGVLVEQRQWWRRWASKVDDIFLCNRFLVCGQSEVP